MSCVRCSATGDFSGNLCEGCRHVINERIRSITPEPERVIPICANCGCFLNDPNNPTGPGFCRFYPQRVLHDRLDWCAQHRPV